MDRWAFAYGRPSVNGELKREPADFKVVEQMPVTPSGEGEHVWILIRKTQLNTEQVAKQIASLAGTSNKSVSYSGRKDFQAITEQWFSVWLPGMAEPDWEQLNGDKLEVLNLARHQRKLRLGTHTSNLFELRIHEVPDSEGELTEKWSQIAMQGVPNYFGSQRFGRHGNNLAKVRAMFAGQAKVRDRRQRGLLLSSARSFLFNECLSHRVADHSWLTLTRGEPAILDGSESYFHAEQASENDPELAARLNARDVHPTCPLPGITKVGSKVGSDDSCHSFQVENAVLKEHSDLFDGLMAAKLESARRATRCLPMNACFDYSEDSVHLKFSLQRGQFATSVVRELITTSL